MKYIVFLPTAQTGGPFALLQLSDALNKLGKDSQVVYYDIIKRMQAKDNVVSIEYNDVFPQNTIGLNTKICFSFDKNDILIFPEVRLDLLKQFFNAGFHNCVFWWLSWDNAPLSALARFEEHSILKKVIHIFQSHYAQIQASKLNIYGPIVSDYTVVDRFMSGNEKIKSNDICYLPSKASGTRKIVSSLEHKFSVTRIENMSQNEVQNTLAKTKFFIDFGHHPGKDRIPREAAMMNCIPIVRLQGAACHMEDVYIPNYLKLDISLMTDTENFTKHLHSLNNNRKEILCSLEPYKRRIRAEMDVFNSQVQDFCELYFS